MADFELLGKAEDETRILRDRASGYSVALVGHPSLVAVPDGTPRYDGLVRLADVEAEHGFRIDDVPSSMPPQALAVAFATAYAKTRAAEDPQVLAIAPRYIPTGAEGGATAQYRIRDEASSNVEQVWVATKPSPTGVWALYHTTRTSLDDVNPIQWFHLRSTCLDQHHWSETESPRSPIWPTSAMGTPTAKLDLTEAEWAVAIAKAKDLPADLPLAIRTELVPFFTSVARVDHPPALVLLPKELEIRWDQLTRMAGPAIADIFLRNLVDCKTALDLRAWAWECVWAIGNRERY